MIKQFQKRRAKFASCTLSKILIVALCTLPRRTERVFCTDRGIFQFCKLFVEPIDLDTFSYAMLSLASKHAKVVSSMGPHVEGYFFKKTRSVLHGKWKSALCTKFVAKVEYQTPPIFIYIYIYIF